MRNCNKIKHTCSSTNYATCIHTEGEVNTDSELFEVECTNLQENLDDIYNQLENLDLSALGELCLSYVQENNKNIDKNVLLKFEEEICTLKNRVKQLEDRQLCDFPITACGIDLKCLSLPCDTSITNLGQLLDAMITKICQNNEQ